jgi:hypothetical protein
MASSSSEHPPLPVVLRYPNEVVNTDVQFARAVRAKQNLAAVLSTLDFCTVAEYGVSLAR